MYKAKCPIKVCRSKNIKFSYKFKNIKYFRCNSCYTYFQNPFPKDNTYKNKYDKKYFEHYQKWSITNLKLKKLRNEQYKYDLRILKKFFKDSPQKKVLDYGCGPGLFLKSLKAKLYGYELNDKSWLEEYYGKILSSTKKYLSLIISKDLNNFYTKHNLDKSLIEFRTAIKHFQKITFEIKNNNL